MVGHLRSGEVSIPAAGGVLGGELHLPEGGNAVVLFAHGSGSSRFSPRNRYVAGELRKRGVPVIWVQHENARDGSDWDGFFGRFVAPDKRAKAAAALTALRASASAVIGSPRSRLPS